MQADVRSRCRVVFQHLLSDAPHWFVHLIEPCREASHVAGGLARCHSTCRATDRAASTLVPASPRMLSRAPHQPRRRTWQAGLCRCQCPAHDSHCVLQPLSALHPGTLHSVGRVEQPVRERGGEKDSTPARGGDKESMSKSQAPSFVPGRDREACKCRSKRIATPRSLQNRMRLPRNQMLVQT